MAMMGDGSDNRYEREVRAAMEQLDDGERERLLLRARARKMAAEGRVMIVNPEVILRHTRKGLTLATDRQVNPPCEVCGTETLHHSDHSGGWNKCPDCSWVQNIRRTPGGQPGFLTDIPEGR